ncbi:MAG: YigZ family protein [Proteobacteria bacterium]|nr:MAG: YigZ family protein [Pseudomonadota bacterium]PIE40050.1 MAG: YigZ family protein [Gammaproteobacteria bacterium]
MAEVYQIPKKPVEVSYEIKKSRFIARAARASDRSQAMALLELARADYPDARHHCWAYLFGEPVSAAMSDDGEPSGTAGKPILNVLRHKDVSDIMIIVIRYFGGIKLGAGGLVRAYSAAAQLAMDALETEVVVPMCSGLATCDFAMEQPVRHWLSVNLGKVLAVDYQADALIRLSFPESAKPHWLAFTRRHGIRFDSDNSVRQ